VASNTGNIKIDFGAIKAQNTQPKIPARTTPKQKEVIILPLTVTPNHQNLKAAFGAIEQRTRREYALVPISRPIGSADTQPHLRQTAKP